MIQRTIEFAPAFRELFRPARYKVYYGGRGGAKSWAVARALLLKGVEKRIRVLCAREYQTSIADSVHKLLKEQIEDMGISHCYEVQKTRIVGTNGTEFIFKGLHHKVQEIKSTEGVDLCWVEEAESVSAESWDVLIPTIRKEDSEIWVTFNPREKEDPTYRRFIDFPPPNAVVKKVSWRDNPWFPDTLREEKDFKLREDPEGYGHVWEGEVRTISDAVVLKGKYRIESFETPSGVRFYMGADWGFSRDPTTLIRCFVAGRSLYVDHEAYAVGCDIDKTPDLFDKVPESRKWPVYADPARPETISYMSRSGFKIYGAKKWSGSVEDGITFLRSFETIVIHERCKHTAEEARLYRFKVDEAGKPLPVLVDGNNHCIDAIRYALGNLIKGRSGKISSGGSRIAPGIFS